ncbi:hypothetical protein [Imhoffiella purpurea]|uniref:Additional component NikL of nickel ECF transporter n=1 Tax=Imhoffiella purpurea TaxID=1249627 RepID=W9VGA7_9GAMM|nr:hypothetical protein [Imhoffiella purpurea]EXJ15072.1 Additional component NikL of nickel ECF transporter [Imhoffiella purpurea]
MPEHAFSARHGAPSAALLLLGLALASQPALAHKLQVFAFAEGARIQGSAYFAGGAKATGALIRIQDATGKTLAELTPDAEGRFSYRATQPADLLVVADSGDGHRAEWRIAADELAGGFPELDPASSTAADGRHDEAADSKARPQNAVAMEPEPKLSGRADDARLLMAIEQAVARQVRPLREELIAAQDRARWHDVLGGIGYIIGLTGLALWMHARSKGGRP